MDTTDDPITIGLLVGGGIVASQALRKGKGGGKAAAALPPLPDPIPTPEEIDIQALEKGEAERRKIRSRRGRASTILTEATLGTTAIAKSPILGVVGGAT